MPRYEVQLTGKSNGMYAATFHSVKAKTPDEAGQKALKRTKLDDASVYQALELSRNYQSRPF